MSITSENPRASNGSRLGLRRLCPHGWGRVVFDLKVVPFEGASVGDIATERTSVQSYFPDIDTDLVRIEECLVSMYDPDNALVSYVNPNERDGMLFPNNFSTTMPNVLDYAAVAGKTIKMDLAGGYEPTATAPLIIKVPAGTTSVGPINVEGWSPDRSQDQAFARHILVDLSDVSGTVSIDGMTMGAIWAPGVDLVYNSNVTTNGQWFAGSVETGHARGEI